MASFFLDALVLTAEHPHVTNPQYVAAICTLVFAILGVYITAPLTAADCNPFAFYIVFHVAYASLVIDDYRHDRNLSIHAYNFAIADIVLAVVTTVLVSIFGCCTGCFFVSRHGKEIAEWHAEWVQYWCNKSTESKTTLKRDDESVSTV